MKTVLITGVSRGIGKATAEKFLSEGWHVLGTSTSGKTDWSHANLRIFQLNLSNPKSIEQVAQEISKQGAIDTLINNAGTYSELEEQDGDTEKLIVKALRDALEVNLVGTIDFTERMIPGVKNGGHILFLGSRMGGLTELKGGTYAPSYSISKVGLSMYTQKLALRLAKKEKIRGSIVDTGWVQTDIAG